MLSSSLLSCSLCIQIYASTVFGDNKVRRRSHYQLDRDKEGKLASKGMAFLLNMEKGAFPVLYILFNVVMILLLPSLTSGAPRADVVERICTTKQHVNSTIQTINFVSTTESVRQQMETGGYGVASSGQGPDAAYILAQCYGDLSLQDCGLCYVEARTLIPLCFPFNGGRIFFDGCFIRKEIYNFFQEYSGPEDKALCGNSSRNGSAFQETTRQAVLQSASYAPNNNGYGRVEMPVSKVDNLSVYVLANCWKSLNVSSCKACLESATTSILGCLPSSEGRALNTGCYMRYSDTNFLNPIPSNGSSKRNSTIVIVSVVVSSSVVAVGVLLIGAYLWKQMRIKKKRKGIYDAKKLAKILRDSSLTFKYSILEKATGGFDEANKIGQGGFGTVYKGVLPDGREIAIKKLFLNDIHKKAAFYNEVNIISSVQHKNLVRLLGCSSSGFDSLLVYEYLPNKSLDHFIFGLNEDKTLTWEERFMIITGVAEGLVYLHGNENMQIIHRDIKASNILLDSRFRAKIADFGLVRSFQDDKSHISTGIVGTLGYMAPEYLVHGRLTEKVDVYSFGVLLFEIITGRQNNENITSEGYSKSLITIVWEHFREETVEELIDRNLMLHNHHNFHVKNEALRVIHIGLLCVQEIPTLRPSMSEALELLVKKDEFLPPPTNPPYIDLKSIEVDGQVENSVATISHSIFYPR